MLTSAIFHCCSHLDPGQRIRVNCQTPHDWSLHDELLHGFLDFGEGSLELDPVSFREAEVQQHLLLHLYEGGLEHQRVSSPVHTGDSHDARGCHLAGEAKRGQPGLKLLLRVLDVRRDPEPRHPLDQSLKRGLGALRDGALGGHQHVVQVGGLREPVVEHVPAIALVTRHVLVPALLNVSGLQKLENTFHYKI